MAGGLETEGTVLSRGDGEASEAFTAIASVSSLSGIGGGSPTVIDVSTLADSFKQKRLGLRDEGQISMTLQWHGSDAEFQGCHADRAQKVLRNWQILFPDGTLAEFAAFVMTFEVQVETDDALRVNCTLEISGEVDIDWGS
jgi:tail tube protein